MNFLACLVLAVIGSAVAAVEGAHSGTPCALRSLKTGLVCVCNTTYCDTLDFDLPAKPGDFVVVSSSQAGLRYSVRGGRLNDSNRLRIENLQHRQFWIWRPNVTESNNQPATVTVDSEQRFQKMIGFGGALTGSVSHLLERIDPKLKEHVYRSYFSLTQGLAFNMIRTSIGGCDFDLEPWAYNEYPINDENLSNFTKLDDRDLLKIKHIREIKQLTGNDDIKLVGAAWSPPRWMKSNNKWDGRGFLKPEFHQTWADYHVRFLKLMKQQNVTFWMISTGNEPVNGAYMWFFVRFMSLGWSPESLGKWLGENLGPTIRSSEFKDVKIFAGDDQRWIFPWWFELMNRGHPHAIDFADGFALHWYWDFLFSPTLLDDTNQKFSDRPILNTESCIGDKPNEVHGPVLGAWARAEQYINYMITQFNHWVTGWIDWNLILDEQGGPNYVNNFVSAPVIVNTTSGTEMYKDTIFYAFGHFSRFVTPDSIRIETLSSDSNIQVVGFKRTDGNFLIIVYNKHTVEMNVTIKDVKRGEIELEIPAKSIHSILYQ